MAQERDKMEAVTAVNAYQEYQAVAKGLARRFGPHPSAIDSFARGFDDHVQELRLHAISVAGSFQKRFGFCQPAERRYTNQSLWHQAYNWQRGDRRRQERVRSFETKHAWGETYDMEATLEARETLMSLLRAFPPEDRVVLLRVAEADGVVRRAWDPDRDGCLRAFERRVARLRKKAALLIQE